MTGPLPLASGRDADVFAIDARHVLRRYRAAPGPVVIDWRNASEGPADLDLAITAVILAQVAVDKDHDLAEPATLLLTAFLQRAGGDPLRMLDRAVEIRAGDPALSSDETGRLASAAALIGRVK